ncbi:uncharacterized protein VTP21DRAFT_366 [Calcarisporiella thermophila]|uniref:uncharacterized protein n=1 Tax=Calcarisporiella thermophila TaxID=911321 RepID=UPI003742CC16
MNRLFGTSKPKQPKPTLNDAILSTDSRVDAIEVKIKKLEAELAKYRDQMNKMREGPGKNAVKSRALRVLKQKRQYEGQRDQLLQQVANMEQTQFTTENLKNVAVSFDALRTASKEMKKQYRGIDIDKIDSIQDELEDLMEKANDVQEALGRSYGVPEEIDEEELDAELDALGDELNFEEEEMPSYLQEPEMPEAPSGVTAESETKEGVKVDEFGLPVAAD